MRVESKYRQAHINISRVRGKASVNPCAWCGGFADEWAYDHADEKQQGSAGFQWSENPDHYIPLCIVDHRAFDSAYRRFGQDGLEAAIAPLREVAGKRYDDDQKAFIAEQCVKQAILNERVLRAQIEERVAQLKQEHARLCAELEMRQRRTDSIKLKSHDSLSGFFPGFFVLGGLSDSFLGNDLFDFYSEWCEELCSRLDIAPFVPLRRPSFYRALEERGAMRKKTAKGIVIYGIKFS
ncbi:hypothetical protein [Streptomyces sp. NPDC057052]|uniref:hypothetical protein n=1 Tax=Streptomyces sp. NPDC057052 TaxID=3346010 RepID=UPI0036364D95